MKTSLTISLLPSSPRAPFVLGPNLPGSVALASQLGFDAIELFPPSVDAIDERVLSDSLQKHSITLSTIGTGGGAVSQGLTLTDADANTRSSAMDYVKSIMNVAHRYGASAIIGSMQGKAGGRDRLAVLAKLREALKELDQFARDMDQVLLFEPLNRYESDLVNTIRDASEIIDSINATHIKILADLFHMNIEEESIAGTLKDYKELIGHIHFVDSNRSVAGLGHTDLEAVVESLRQIGYSGFLAIEAFPLPDQESAARGAMNWFIQHKISSQPSGSAN